MAAGSLPTAQHCPAELCIMVQHVAQCFLGHFWSPQLLHLWVSLLS